MSTTLTLEEQISILKESYHSYAIIFASLGDEDNHAVDDQLRAAKDAIAKKNIKKALQAFIALFHAIDEFDLPIDNIDYPGPGRLYELLTYDD